MKAENDINKVRELELLSPAKDLATAIAAIDCGADAVYIGAEAFGARSKAGNSLEDISRLVAYARPFGVRIYVTVNTIIYDSELNEASRLIRKLYDIGVDALIVQDMGLLKLDLPPIALHASTQCDIRDADKARLLTALGFERIVVARELAPDDIAEIHRAVPGVEIEAFVHGALCVSYSGDCHAGFALMGRSANRGDCPQICRLKFSLTDAAGKSLRPDAHFLSLKDMNRLEMLKHYAGAGVCSFKIEGRLKDINYVKTVVRAYSRELDRIVAESSGTLRRSSRGIVKEPANFILPGLDKVFNREFTSYIFKDNGPGASASIGRIVSPKWLGEEIGTVSKVAGRRITVNLRKYIVLNNGDGLMALAPSSPGTFAARIPPTDETLGFRINRAEGNVVFTAEDVPLRPGWKLFRNRDMAFDSLMERTKIVRKLPVDVSFAVLPGDRRVKLTMSDRAGHEVAVTMVAEASQAASPQKETREKNFAKLGETPFILNNYVDRGPELFVPLSKLTVLRREAVENLLKNLEATKQRNRRLGVNAEAARAQLEGKLLDYHWNVANHSARELYESLGAKVVQPALEADSGKDTQGRVVMTTRYCLRRQLGACLKTPGAVSLPKDLFLRSPGICLRLDFDCRNCLMKVIKN